MRVIIVKTTCSNSDEARKIILHLLNKRLISSANFFPINSISSWAGKVQEVDETLIFLKTRSKYWKKVKEEIKLIHSYKVPCILKINVCSNKEYESWINKQTEQIKK